MKFHEFVHLLETQRESYSRLLQLTKKFNKGLGENVDPEALLPIVAQREKTLDGIKNIDQTISMALSVEGQSGWLEKNDCKEIVDQLQDLIKMVIEQDEASSNALTKIKHSVRKKYKSMVGSKKSISGYGTNKKDEYAKFIDFRH